MSLVEQALKKMQQTRDANPPAPTQRAIPAAPQSPAPAARVPHAPPEPQRAIRVNLDGLRTAGFLAPDSQERKLANEYRHIKRPLIGHALGRGGDKLPNGHLIAVTSSLPGDGKTFTSINLALSMAQELDLSVLLVDADVSKRHISRLLGVENERGLLDVLREEKTDIDAPVLATGIDRLQLLPAGTHAENATELLASPRMEQVVRHLGASESRIVLFDSAPLLLTSESRALCGQMGQVLLVVCAGSTPQRAVFDALSILGAGKSVSIVLNQSEESELGEYGYSYYGQDGAVKDGQSAPPGPA